MTAPRRRQRGIATVLIVLLVGLTLTAGVLGTVAHVRSLQEQDVATHAQTQAQVKAWLGAELALQYLQKLPQPQRQDLRERLKAQPGVALVFGPQDRRPDLPQVEFVRPEGPEDDSFHARITGVAASGTRAEARSVLRVVYDVGPAAPDTVSGLLTYNRDLKLGGSISVLRDADDANVYAVNVIGDIDTSGNSITGVNQLMATGGIHLTSGSSFDLLRANCDVNIEGSVTVRTIEARRHVCATGAAGTGPEGTIRANGSITTAAGIDRMGTFYARAQPRDVAHCAAAGFMPAWNSTSAPSCPQPALNGVHFNGGNAGARTVETAGDVRIDSGTLGMLRAQGSLTVQGNARVDGGTVGGSVTRPAWNAQVLVNRSPGYTVDVHEVAKVVIERDTFNAWDVEAQSNFAFKMDNGYRKVTVRNVEGIADGTYFLGNYPGGGYKDYLCTKVRGDKAAPECISPARTATTTLCKGYSDYNECFSYGTGTGWRIQGASMAPGVAWFEGSLEVASGTYYNTFIATGNIRTSGSHVTYAPNFAGYSGKVGSTTHAPEGVCANSLFPRVRPRQFCSADGRYTPTPLGNYAFMAGSRDDEHFENIAGYFGGNITLGSSSQVYGNLRAGNELSSGGSTVIHGSGSALALGVKVTNSLGGSTTFDLRNLPKTFSLPQQAGAGSAGGGTAGGQVHLKWARYQ